MQLRDLIRSSGIAYILLFTAMTAHATLHSVVRSETHVCRQTSGIDSFYSLSTSKKVSMSLSGTTPIKNWTMKATQLSGTANLTISSDSRLERIESLDFTLPVSSLEGDEPKMDAAAYRSLKADQYPYISFVLTSATIVTSGSATLVKALGILSVAGVTRLVTLRMHSIINADGTVTFAGMQPLKMSDYNVERPSILLGAIKAGDDIELSYHLIFIK